MSDDIDRLEDGGSEMTVEAGPERTPVRGADERYRVTETLASEDLILPFGGGHVALIMQSKKIIDRSNKEFWTDPYPLVHLKVMRDLYLRVDVADQLHRILGEMLPAARKAQSDHDLKKANKQREKEERKAAWESRREGGNQDTVSTGSGKTAREKERVAKGEKPSPEARKRQRSEASKQLRAASRGRG